MLCISLVSCGGNGGIEITLAPETEEQAGSRDNVYSITINNTSIAPHDDLTDIIPALGKYIDYAESTSCAYLGLDKVYVYSGYTIYTYPVDGVDYVYDILGKLMDKFIIEWYKSQIPYKGEVEAQKEEIKQEPKKEGMAPDEKSLKRRGQKVA